MNMNVVDQRTGQTIWRAPDASDDGKRSSGIGELPLSGLSDTAYLIQLLRNSERQELQINELNKSVQFLAQQVKTLVDALAENADPDAPLTNYMSGKPI